MIRSMTGYGRASFQVRDVPFEVEARSVNHRYLDSRVRLPRVLAEYEGALKLRAQALLGRGKLDLNVSLSGDAAGASRLELDLGSADQYVEAAATLRERHGLSGELDVRALLALPGVTRMVEPALADEDAQGALIAAVDSALEALDDMRQAEGEALARELDGRLASVLRLAGAIEKRSDLVQQAARERLRKRAEQLRSETGLLDEARLHQEVVIAADRLDVTEEIVRLRSHVEQFRQIVSEAERSSPVGRRLDFLMQEMGREANTIGSKASDAPISHDVVELKTELERIREQVQNVE